MTDIDAELDDPDAEYTLTIKAPQGALSATSTSDVMISGTSQELILKGNVVDLNSFIENEGVMYTPVQNFYGDVTFDLTVDDGGNNDAVDNTPLTASSTLLLTLEADNDAPTITLLSSTVTIDDAVGQKVKVFQLPMLIMMRLTLMKISKSL